MVGESPVATASRNAKSPTMASTAARSKRARSASVRSSMARVAESWRIDSSCTALRIEANVSTIVTPWASAIRETIKMSSRFLKLVNVWAL